jgi:hypothetical protein
LKGLINAMRTHAGVLHMVRSRIRGIYPERTLAGRTQQAIVEERGGATGEPEYPLHEASRKRQE